MSALKWILIPACAVALTGCPDNSTLGKNERETAKFSGVWVRTNDYCDYMTSGYGPVDSRCNDFTWEDNRTVLANDDAWLLIAITRQGGINSFSMDSFDESNKNWGLGYITPEGFYQGYLTTMNRRNHMDVIHVYVDGEFLTIFNESTRNRVGFIRLTEREAREFESAYNDCGKNAYCKGQNVSTKERRQAKRDRNNGKFDQQKYDECISRGGSETECADEASS